MKTVAILCVIALSVLVSRPVLGDETTESAENEEYNQLDTKLPIGPILLGSFGLAAVATGAGFAWQADEERDDFNKTPTKMLADDAKAHAVTANILLFGGAAAVASSLLWLLLTRDDDDETDEIASAVVVTPLIAPGHATLSITF